MNKLFSALSIAGLLSCGGQAFAFDMSFSNGESVAAATVIRQQCTTVACIKKEVDDLRKAIRRKPDYAPLDSELQKLQGLLVECQKSCGGSVRKDIQRETSHSTNELKASGHQELAVFGMVFEAVGARLK